MNYGNLLKKKVNVEEFLTILEKYENEMIECTDHTFFRLSQSQRKIFKCEELRKIIKQQKPFLVGLQYNGNYAVFYKHMNKTMRIILRLDVRKINIVTFYFIEDWQIPKI